MILNDRADMLVEITREIWSSKPRTAVPADALCQALKQHFSGWWFGTYIGKSHDEIPQRMSGWWFMDGLWNHGMDYEFPIIIIGNFIIPTDFHSIIFQRGWNHQPVFSVGHRYWQMTLYTVSIKCQFDILVDFPMNNGDFPWQTVK